MEINCFFRYRLMWCQEHVQRSKIRTRLPDDKGSSVSRERFSDFCAKEHDRYGSGSVGVTGDHTLAIWFKDTMTVDRYQGIITSVVTTTVDQHSFVFRDYNATSHRTRTVKQIQHKPKSRTFLGIESKELGRIPGSLHFWTVPKADINCPNVLRLFLWLFSW